MKIRRCDPSADRIARFRTHTDVRSVQRVASRQGIHLKRKIKEVIIVDRFDFLFSRSAVYANRLLFIPVWIFVAVFTS